MKAWQLVKRGCSVLIPGTDQQVEHTRILGTSKRLDGAGVYVHLCDDAGSWSERITTTATASEVMRSVNRQIRYYLEKRSLPMPGA